MHRKKSILLLSCNYTLREAIREGCTSNSVFPQHPLPSHHHLTPTLDLSSPYLGRKEGQVGKMSSKSWLICLMKQSWQKGKVVVLVL